jgi:hypothetical protein
LRQLWREVLAQLDVKFQGIDIVCHNRHTASNKGDPS